MTEADRELDRILADHFSESSPRPFDAEDEARLQAEMDALLAQGEDAVFAGIDPALRKKMLDPPRHGRRLAFAAAGLAAAAALIAAILIARTTQRAPDGELTIEVRGGFSELRGADVPAEIPRYGPENELSIQFTETDRPGGVPAQAVRAFLVGAKDQLAPLSLRITRTEDEGVTTFKLEGRAGALFGAVSGVKTLAFAFASSLDALQALSGLELEEARARGGIRWVIQRIEFIRPSGAATEARLVRYARLVGTPGRTIPVFTETDLPRIQVRGDASEPWGLELRIRDREAERVPVNIQARGPYLLLDIHPPPAHLREAGELALVLGEERVAKWPMTWARLPEDEPAVHEARQAVARDDPERALEILTTAAAAVAAERSWSGYWVQFELGRVQLKLGMAKQAWQTWRSAQRLAEELGSPTEAAARLRACAFIDLDTGQFDRAAEEIAAALQTSTAAGDDWGTARAEYLGAMLLQKRNAPNASLLAQQKYTQLLESAHARGDDEEARTFALLLATALAEQGNRSEAQKLLAKYHPPGLEGRAGLDYALNAAYVERLGFDGEGRPANMASTLRAKARTLLERLPAEARPSDRAFILADVIRYSLALGDLSAAEEAATALREIDPEKLLSARWDRDLILAEVELRAGRLDGLESRFIEIQERAEAQSKSNMLDVAFIAETMIGETRLQRGDRQGAEAQLRTALEHANALARHFAAPRARDSYRSRRSDSERLLAAMLVEDQRAEDALLIVERSRARAIAELAAQVRAARAPDAWTKYLETRTSFEQHYPGGCARARANNQPACSTALAEVEQQLSSFYADTWSGAADKTPEAPALDLRSLPAGSALFSVARSPAGTISFWAHAGTVRAAFVDDDALAPWENELESVERIYVSADERSLIEELPLRPTGSGEPLGSKVELVALAHRARGDTRFASGAWVVVADPWKDLPEARNEGIDVAARGKYAHLYAGDRAGHEVISELAEYPSLFHFSGHGSVPASDAWSAQLELHGEQRIRIQDVLAEALSAEVIVLNGCATAAVDKEARFGLPEAFIAEDARFVLATITSVSDANARRFMSFFYQFGGADSPPAAFRQAFAEMWRMGEHVSFRLWGREG